MKTNQKRKLVVGAIVSMCFATAIGVTSLTAVADQASAEVTKKTIDQVTFTMIEGAGVRLETNGNGLRFGASTTASDYTALMANVGDGADYAYKEIKFGMLIAPAYYEDYYELNEKYVFSAEAKYDWAVDGEYKGTNGENGSKVRIANLQAREMFVDETKGTATYYGSIVDLNDGDGEEVNNLALQFKGVGYVQYTLQDETVDYLFLDGNDNVRSMAYVAQQAIADETSADRLTSAQKQTVNDIYVSKVTETASTYTVNYYLQNADGSYTLANTVSEEKTINAEVTLQNVYYADYHLAKGANTTFKVLANDKSVLNFYYDRGAVWNTVENVTDLEAQTASHIDLVGTGDTDSWYNVSKETIEGKGEFIKWSVKDGKNNWAYRHGFNVLPAYEKEYYELYQGKGYQLVFDFMYEAKDKSVAGTKYAYYNNKKDSVGIDNVVTDTWYTAIQPLDSLIANWDALQVARPTTLSVRPVVEVGSLITLKTKATNVRYDMYIGNFRLVPPAVNAVEDTTVNLVDISSNNLVQNDKLNLMDLVSNENKTALRSNLNYADCLTYTIKDSTGAVATVENGIVDISKITLRYYTFTIAYNKTVIYTGYVDLYDATQGVIWNTLDLVNTASEWKTHQGATHNTETNQYYTFSVENIEKTKYAKWTANGHNSWSFGYQQGFALLPLHTLDYYKLFEGQGYKVSFEINYYLQDTTSALTYSKYIKGNDGVAYTLACGAEKWKKISFNLDSLITRYDYITKTSTSDGYSSALFTFQGYESGSSAEAKKAPIYVYMSEMTIAKA